MAIFGQTKSAMGGGGGTWDGILCEILNIPLVDSGQVEFLPPYQLYLYLPYIKIKNQVNEKYDKFNRIMSLKNKEECQPPRRVQKQYRMISKVYNLSSEQTPMLP